MGEASRACGARPGLRGSRGFTGAIRAASPGSCAAAAREKGHPITATSPRPRRRIPWTWVAGLALLIGGSVAFVKHKDQDNQFCISCHLHEQIHRNTVAEPPPTLSGGHYRAKGSRHPERCFTCHSGEGVVGWSQVTLLSAWDAARWVLGDRHEPTRMRLPLSDQACLKCHAADVRGTKSEEETVKYHEMSSHRAVSIPCASCHVTHKPGVRAKQFLDDETVRGRCRGCHDRLEEG